MSRLPTAEDRLDNLPITRLKTGGHCLRITRTTHPSPVFFNPAPGGRFNPRSGSFGTLYGALDLTGALAESICRGAASLPRNQRVISELELEVQGLYKIVLRGVLQMLDLTVPNLARYGLDARIFAEYEAAVQEYQFGPVWADHAWALGLNGILYPSRHHTSSHCLALFECDVKHLPWVFQTTLLASDQALMILEDTFDWGIC